MAPDKLLVKNMVCQRCINTVVSILNKLEIPYEQVVLGEILFSQAPGKDKKEQLATALQQQGFEVTTSRIQKIISDIKLRVMDYIKLGIEKQQLNLSGFITQQVHYDYSYLSDLFSSVEGKTIEQYFLLQRIEKVKELLVYDQMSLTEIAYETGFSSVQHLSTQFKKLTGLTPSYYRKLGENKRRSADNI